MESVQKDIKKGNVQVTVEKGTSEKGIQNVAEKGAIRKGVRKGIIKDTRRGILVGVENDGNGQKVPEMSKIKKESQAEVEKDSVQVAIEKMLRRGKRGQLYFPADFRNIASEGAIKMALSRLCGLNKVKRLTHGLYWMPVIDPVLGEITPSMEEIAEAVAVKECVRIKPTGAFALNILGLTEKRPESLVYLTNGTSRKINIGDASIRFKATRARKLSGIGKFSSLAILALEDLGTEGIDAGLKDKLKLLLLKEDPKRLQHDVKLASAKVSVFVTDLLSEN